MSGRWWKGNECRGAAILFHLFWLQTVGNSRLSKASHHLFLFLNMSVPQSVKLGHFLFGFQQKEGFDCSDISFPAIANVPCLNFNSLPAFYLFIFILSPVPSRKPTHLWFQQPWTPFHEAKHFASTDWVKLSGFHPPLIAYLSQPASIWCR